MSKESTSTIFNAIVMVRMGGELAYILHADQTDVATVDVFHAKYH